MCILNLSSICNAKQFFLTLFIYLGQFLNTIEFQWKDYNELYEDIKSWFDAMEPGEKNPKTSANNNCIKGLSFVIYDLIHY